MVDSVLVKITAVVEDIIATVKMEAEREISAGEANSIKLLRKREAHPAFR